MTNPVFSDEYKVVVSELISARRQAGVSQRELGARLGRAQSHICRIEQQQRRVDVLEFYRIAKALGRDPTALFERITARIESDPAPQTPWIAKVQPLKAPPGFLQWRAEETEA